MVVQLDEVQKQTVYQVLAGMNLERYQETVKFLIDNGTEPRLLLQLIRSVFEEGQSSAYQQGIRIGENYGAEVALRLLAQRLNGKDKDSCTPSSQKNRHNR